MGLLYLRRWAASYLKLQYDYLPYSPGSCPKACRKSWKKLRVQNFRKSGTCSFFFFAFFEEGQSKDLQRLHRVSLHPWQKSQSGQGFFFCSSTIFFSIFLLYAVPDLP